MAWYRNRETGIVQYHPVSGRGDSFNSDEVDDGGKVIKPRVPLGASREETKRLANLAKAPKTTEATTGDGDSNKQEGTK